MNMLFEFVPLVLFLGTLLYKDIYAAVTVLMIAMPVAFVIKYLRTNKFDRMYFWSTVLLLVAGTLTLYLRNDLFIKWKPTVFYWAVAIAFLVSRFVSDKPLAQRFFGLVEGMNFDKISTQQWQSLNLIWVAFFVLAGLLNIYVAYNYSLETWGFFKVFGLMALTFVFVLGQTLWIAKHVGEDARDDQPEQE